MDLKENLLTEVNFSPEDDEPKTVQFTHLDLAYNKIKNFPRNLGNNLQYLDLHNNQIVEINKEDIKGLKSLVSLNLSGNLITIIGFQIRKFPELISLNLSFNRIETLDSWFFDENSVLKNLILSYNPLSNIHPRIGVMEKLVKLDLRSTKLTVLPNSLGLLKHLENLFLENVILKDPPMHIIIKGFFEIMDFFRKNPFDYKNELKEPLKRQKTIKELQKKTTEINVSMEAKDPELTQSKPIDSDQKNLIEAHSLKNIEKKIYSEVNSWLHHSNSETKPLKASIL